jgi:hypothetical protein
LPASEWPTVGHLPAVDYGSRVFRRGYELTVPVWSIGCGTGLLVAVRNADQPMRTGQIVACGSLCDAVPSGPWSTGIAMPHEISMPRPNAASQSTSKASGRHTILSVGFEFDPLKECEFTGKPFHRRKVGPNPDSVITLEREFCNLVAAIAVLDQNLERNPNDVETAIRHLVFPLSRIYCHTNQALRLRFYGDQMIQVDGADFASYHEALLHTASERFRILGCFHRHPTPQLSELVDFDKLRNFAKLAALNTAKVRATWSFSEFDLFEWFRRLHFEAVRADPDVVLNPVTSTSSEKTGGGSRLLASR